MKHSVKNGIHLLAISGLFFAGCGLDIAEIIDELDLDDIEITIDESVNIIQEIDPREAELPVDLAAREEVIFVDNSVDVIVDVSNDLVVEELPDLVLIGFENLTGADIYVTYLVDGVLEGVLVFVDETLLLEYNPCVDEIELLLEEDFDPITGEFIEEFPLEGTLFVNPFDFACGTALIITFDPVAISAETELIDLVIN
ncbi:MAG: hypothetical protein ACYTHJ_13250 [Planctomycetota bacterium]|jgi:hypothetical protein